MMKGFLKILLILFLPLIVQSQKESYNWYFGIGAGITFNPNGVPSALTNSAMSSGKGCATISDSCTGQLYFYTNGDSIINRNHQTMLNGTNLDGSSGSTQSAIIVPSPDGSTGEYYVFTVERTNGLKYSIVDLNLGGGLGGVIAGKKNLALVNPTVEKVTALRHQNQKYVWIITHKLNSNEFYSFLLTDTALISTPVISSVGANYGTGSQLGYMKASPRGDQLALALTGDKRYDLFDFDNSTGIVSNPRSSGSVYNFAYGVEFSPNGSKLYVTSNLGLYQYDLDKANANKPLGDSIFLGPDPTVAIQLGPNGIIYCNEGKKLGSISKPDLAGNLCNYAAGSVGLSNRFSSSGLPTFMQSYFSPMFIEEEGICLGITTQFEIFSERKIDSLLWNFGEPSSGALNTSKLKSPQHLYNDTGLFLVNVYAYSQKCGITRIDTVQKLIHIVDLPIPNIDLGNDTIICEGDTVLLWTDGLEPNYLWSTGSTESEIKVTNENKYWVKGSNTCGSLIDTIKISYFNSNLFADLGKDTALCSGESIRFNIKQEDATYLWSDGSDSYEILVRKPGTVWVRVEDLCYVGSDTVEIRGKLKPKVNLGNDTTICDGTVLTLNAFYPNASYVWSDLSTDPTFEITDEGPYRVTVTNECGNAGDDIYVRSKDCRCFVFVPNSFTPNDDGLNDELIVSNNCEFINYSFEVFNRWGEIIFRTTTPGIGWDGSLDGKKAGLGMYHYLVKYKSTDPFDDEDHQLRGMVNLIK